MANLRIGQVSCPDLPPAIDEVVRSAGQAPAADRRPHGNALPIVSQAPVGWRQRKCNLVAAAASAEMHYHGVLERDVEDALLKARRHRLHVGLTESPGPAPAASSAGSSFWRDARQTVR